MHCRKNRFWFSKGEIKDISKIRELFSSFVRVFLIHSISFLLLYTIDIYTTTHTHKTNSHKLLQSGNHYRENYLLSIQYFEDNQKDDDYREREKNVKC